MSEEKILNEINPFVEACDKMIASKFIMIDKRISDVLKSIAKTELVFEYIKECMINFNFNKEWKVATEKVGQMLPPEENHKFVAFVFSVLNCMDDKKISASELLSKYFSKAENESGPYAYFCEMLIEKFKNIVVSKILNKSEGAIVVKKEKVASNIDKDVLARLAFLVKDLKDYVQGIKKIKKSTVTKGELIEIINGLYEAIKKEETIYIKPFVVAIKSAHGKDKEIEYRLLEILDIISKTFIDV